MGNYIARRLLLLFPTLLLVSLVVFWSVRLQPGDVVDAKLAQAAFAGGTASPERAEELRREMGLDEPAAKQYFVWLGNVVKGDLGHSLFVGRSVRSELWRAVPVSLELAIMAIILSILIAVPLGVLAAIHQDSWIDHVARLFSVGGLAIPNFVVGTVVIVTTSKWLGWSPPIGYRPFFDSPGTNLVQFIIPAAILGLVFSSTTLRMVRSSMLEVLRADYLRTAWAKGLSQRTVIVRHALKNAMIAPLTMVGAQIGLLLGGAVIIESIFSLPGIGRLTLEAVMNRDYPQLQGAVMFLAVVFVLINLVVDISYGWLDPRIRYS